MSTVKTEVGRFVWHDHMSNDPAKAREFYAKLLGWEIEIWKPGEMDYPMITVNGQMHGGFGPAQGGAPSHWLGHVAVENADETARRAREAGGSVLGEPMDIPEVGRMAVIQDPQGAVFSAFTAAGEVPPSQGVFLWDEVLTTDPEAAKGFYAKVVGWTAEDMNMGDMVYTIFSTGDAQRAGCTRVPADAEWPPYWQTHLASNDVDRDAAKAEELGATKYMGPTDIPTVGRVAVLADPTGATFGLFKPSDS
jgi:uncharacterized protein